MNLQQLRHFVVLSETGNFHKAAAQLHMTQPPLSASIRRLESDLGVVLFIRDAKGVKLTAAGVSVLDQARSALFYVQQVRDVARAVTSGEGGHLRVGFIGSATFSFMPRVMPAYSERFPNVRLELHESTTEKILAAINERVLDLGLIRYPIYRACDATIEKVEFDTLAIALPLTHPLAKRKSISLDSLKSESFIIYSRTEVPNLHAMVIDLCQQANFAPHIAQETVQIQTVLSLVESGLGVALVPTSAGRYAAGRIALRKLTGVKNPGATGIAIAYRTDLETAVSRRFRETVRAVLKGTDTYLVSKNNKMILDISEAAPVKTDV